GFIPSAPEKPKFLISIRVLQLYHAMQLRCPQMSVQPFVKSLCGLHGSAYRPTLCEQFTICYDAFIAVREGARARALAAVGRGGPDWRLKNACPCCCYKLSEEPKLTFEMLITMDGNNSLKRVLRRDPKGGESVERVDTRCVGGDYYLPRDDVDRWAKGKGLAKGNGAQVCGRHFNPSGCSDRWKNLTESITSKMWSVFDETGIFTSLCRHGFVLVLADMVQSGELSKYPLAVVSKLLEVFGADLGSGYDIGCGFETTLLNSALGELATKLNYHSLVGSFHGHAHNRICQLTYLATYIRGLGIEDLEGCERFFSKSNALASSTRYASRFHRSQKITQYIKGNDYLEVYANISKFLVNNYKQALEILAGETEFKRACEAQGISDVSVFPQWLAEEMEYLTSLKKEPEEETLQMTYLEKLVKLYEYENKLGADQSTWVSTTNPQSYNVNRGDTARRERQQRQTIELRDNTLVAVHELENKLLILPSHRWRPGSAQWVETQELLRKRNYQKCLDQLESLVVARLFEMAKMNLPQTALKTRSQAIRTALEKYNLAASKLRPPGRTLDWDEISEYSFLSEFDLLRDSRQDIRKKPWAKPAARRLMDRFFKLERAREEITRLNVEIRRLVTYIEDEERFFEVSMAVLKTTNAPLAHEVYLYSQERGRANTIHRQRLQRLSSMDGFTGTLEFGVRRDQSTWLRAPVKPGPRPAPNAEDEDEDSDHEHEQTNEGRNVGESDDEDDAGGLGWITDKLVEYAVAGDADGET
ncbi:hypothetical protein BDN72DRAFT_780810, partial [Pluteus cervinus]